MAARHNLIWCCDSSHANVSDGAHVGEASDVGRVEDDDTVGGCALSSIQPTVQSVVDKASSSALGESAALQEPMGLENVANCASSFPVVESSEDSNEVVVTRDDLEPNVSYALAGGTSTSVTMGEANITTSRTNIDEFGMLQSTEPVREDMHRGETLEIRHYAEQEHEEEKERSEEVEETINPGLLLNVQKFSIAGLFIFTFVICLEVWMYATTARTVNIESTCLGMLTTLPWAHSATAAAIARGAGSGFVRCLTTIAAILWILPVLVQVMFAKGEVLLEACAVFVAFWIVHVCMLLVRQQSRQSFAFAHGGGCVISFVLMLGHFMRNALLINSIMVSNCNDIRSCALTTATAEAGMTSAQIIAIASANNTTSILHFENATIAQNGTPANYAYDIDSYIYNSTIGYARLKAIDFHRYLGQSRDFWYTNVGFVIAIQEMYHVEFCDMTEDRLEHLRFGPMEWLSFISVFLSAILLSVAWVSSNTVFGQITILVILLRAVLSVVLCVHTERKIKNALQQTGLEVIQTSTHNVPRKLFRKIQCGFCLIAIAGATAGGVWLDLNPLRIFFINYPFVLFAVAAARIVKRYYLKVISVTVFATAGTVSCIIGIDDYDSPLHEAVTYTLWFCGTLMVLLLPIGHVASKTTFLRRVFSLTGLALFTAVRLLSTAWTARDYYDQLCVGQVGICDPVVRSPPIFDDSIEWHRVDMRPYLFAQYYAFDSSIGSDGVVYAAFTFTMLLPAYWATSLRIQFAHFVWLRRLSPLIILHCVFVATLSVEGIFAEVLYTKGSLDVLYILVIFCIVSLTVALLPYAYKQRLNSWRGVSNSTSEMSHKFENVTFHASLDRSLGLRTASLTQDGAEDALGIQVIYPRHQHIVVASVKDEGLVALWNANDDVEHEIRQGDEIVEVNGFKEDIERMTEELKMASFLLLTMTRHHKEEEKLSDGSSLEFRFGLLVGTAVFDVILMSSLTWIRCRSFPIGIRILASYGFDFFVPTILTLHFLLLCTQAAKSLRMHRAKYRGARLFVFLWVTLRLLICACVAYSLENSGFGLTQPHGIVGWIGPLIVIGLMAGLSFNVWRDSGLDRRKHISRLIMLCVPVIGGLVRQIAWGSFMNDWYFERLELSTDFTDPLLWYWTEQVATPSGAAQYDLIVNAAHTSDLAQRQALAMVFMITLPSYWIARTHTNIRRITAGHLLLRERVNLFVFGVVCFYCLVDVAIDHAISTFILSFLSAIHTLTLTYLLARHRDSDIHESYHNKDVIAETSKMAFTALVGDQIRMTTIDEAEEDDDQFDDEAGGVAAADEMIDGIYQGVGDV